mgnify:CR=1 FL=1
MTADGRLPIDQRRNYKNVFDAIRRISKTEGVTTLWRGVIPTVGFWDMITASLRFKNRLNFYRYFTDLFRIEVKPFAYDIYLHADQPPLSSAHPKM